LKNGIIKAAQSTNRCAGKLKAGVAMTRMEAAGKSDQGPEWTAPARVKRAGQQFDNEPFANFKPGWRAGMLTPSSNPHRKGGKSGLRALPAGGVGWVE
jgi:hypothetical protein